MSDFGLSRVLSNNRTQIKTQTFGTVTHMPPELLSKGILAPSADVFAMGVLMWEVYSADRQAAEATVKMDKTCALSKSTAWFELDNVTHMLAHALSICIKTEAVKVHCCCQSGGTLGCLVQLHNCRHWPNQQPFNSLCQPGAILAGYSST